ncbi:MAG TPA: UrcA family protein [Allosphingosinicella sp.]|jgi:UrcA family protein|nr:UrcA family protein [Allosphingosinicella sp.]
MFVRVLSTLGALAATAVTLAFATPASAQEETRTVVVSFAGLDLANPADAARLEQRLHGAARQVCGPDEGTDLRARRDMDICQKTALVRAHAEVQIALRGGSDTQVALTTK